MYISKNSKERERKAKPNEEEKITILSMFKPQSGHQIMSNVFIHYLSAYCVSDTDSDKCTITELFYTS